MPMHRGIFIQTVPHCDPQGLSLFHSKNRPRHLIAICQHASRRSGVGPEVTISRGNCQQYFPWTGSGRSEEHTSELQSLMRISYAVFCLKKNNKTKTQQIEARQINIVTMIHLIYE